MPAQQKTSRHKSGTLAVLPLHHPRHMWSTPEQCAESDIYQSHHISSSQLGHIGAPPKHVQHAALQANIRRRGFWSKRCTKAGEETHSSSQHTAPGQNCDCHSLPICKKNNCLDAQKFGHGPDGRQLILCPLIEQNQAIQCPCLQMADSRLSVHPCPLLKLIA